MKVPPAPPPALQQILDDQDGAMTAAQALGAGLTQRQLRTLIGAGWKHPFHGIYVAPTVRDPFRTSVRAALLACPTAAAHGATGARLRELWGMPVWSPAEEPVLILPKGQTFNPRRGLRLHSGLGEDEREVVGGFPAASLTQTLHRLALDIALDDLVCAVDSAMRAGWEPMTGSHRGRKRLAQAVAPPIPARSRRWRPTAGCCWYAPVLRRKPCSTS